MLGDLHSQGKIQRLIDISNGWYVITEARGELFFNDLRFGVLDANAESPAFVFSYHIMREPGRVEIQEVERKPAEGKKLLNDLGKRILGN